jgi:uncharacterized membrane protein YhaH (DUF805 family)
VDGSLALVVGLLLVGVGAAAATVTQRRFEDARRTVWAPLAIVPFGVLMGAGAAIARGWDLWLSAAVGAIVVPLVGVIGRLVEVRRRRGPHGPGRTEDVT